MPDLALSGPATCPRCGLTLESRQKFCAGCRLELGAQAPPHILPHGARGPARRGCLPAPALLVLLVVGLIVVSQVAQGLFGLTPDAGPTPAPTRTGPPRLHVVPPTSAPRLPAPTPEGAAGNLDIVASASYRDRAGTLCLVGVLGNDLDLGRGVEVTAGLVDAAGTTLAEARSRYYPSGLLPAGVRLPFRLELAQPPPAWRDIRWDLRAFDAPGEAETVYHGLRVVDPVLRPPTGPAAPWTLAGQIANTGARAARPLRLYAAVYDAAGALLDATEADGPPDPLAPGAQTPFTLALPRPDMQPTRAEVVVEGH